MKRILFVCTGNTCRSPMAQALFQDILAKKSNKRDIEFEVSSAGLHTQDGIPASPEAIEAVQMEGIDLSSHKSRHISEDLLKQADLILTMTTAHCSYLRNNFPEQRASIYTLSEFAGVEVQEISDPYGMGGPAYLKTVKQLKELLEEAAVRLLGDLER